MTIANLRYPRWIGIQHGLNYELPEDLILTDQGRAFKVPAGTEITTFQSENFGWVVLPVTKAAPWGQRIFKL